MKMIKSTKHHVNKRHHVHFRDETFFLVRSQMDFHYVDARGLHQFFILEREIIEEHAGGDGHGKTGGGGDQRFGNAPRHEGHAAARLRRPG
jgi:hypothetical protein